MGQFKKENQLRNIRFKFNKSFFTRLSRKNSIDLNFFINKSVTYVGESSVTYVTGRTGETAKPGQVFRTSSRFHPTESAKTEGEDPIANPVFFYPVLQPRENLTTPRHTVNPVFFTPVLVPLDIRIKTLSESIFSLATSQLRKGREDLGIRKKLFNKCLAAWFSNKALPHPEEIKATLKVTETFHSKASRWFGYKARLEIRLGDFIYCRTLGNMMRDVCLIDAVEEGRYGGIPDLKGVHLIEGKVTYPYGEVEEVVGYEGVYRKGRRTSREGIVQEGKWVYDPELKTMRLVEGKVINTTSGDFVEGKFAYIPELKYVDLVEGKKFFSSVEVQEGKFAYIPEIKSSNLVEGKKTDSNGVVQEGKFEYDFRKKKMCRVALMTSFTMLSNGPDFSTLPVEIWAEIATLASTRDLGKKNEHLLL